MMLRLLLFLAITQKCVVGYSCIKENEVGQSTKFQYCEPSKLERTCRCNHIQINGTGYSDCKSVHNGKRWCYVNENSPCRDKTLSSKNKAIQEDTHTGYNVGKIYWSEAACQNPDYDSSIDLPTFLPGYELAREKSYGGENVETSIFAPTPEACETECYTRKRNCDAWTFIASEDQENPTENCQYPKTVDGKLCTFPFRYKDRKYFGCTTDDSDNGKAWCATTIDSKGKVIDGKWGDCQDCNNVCKTVQNENCIFPFKYKGKKYSECTTQDSENGKAWCATKVSSGGNVIFGRWDDCGNGCGSTSRTARNTKNTCFLEINQNVCWNTLSSRRKNANAISGFNCFLGGGENTRCWSTKGQARFCPFIFEAAQADADGATHTSGTAGIASIRNPRRYSRVLFRFINGRWRTVRRRQN